ncbi:hypothetical protein JCGZ_05097 [Jatropha curcas]|uniref:Uncharacterized protein n=1 Tax=Jatropha curcas TaxID=180498 RepID=A0A067LQ56_JATCU|nr:hypothetical protein JCGZ_05097 [Jatropha curcas]
MNLHPSVPKNLKGNCLEVPWGGTDSGRALTKERCQPSHWREELMHLPSKAPIQTGRPTSRPTVTPNIFFGIASPVTNPGVHEAEASHAPQSLTSIGGSQGTRVVAFNAAPQNTYTSFTMVP